MLIRNSLKPSAIDIADGAVDAAEIVARLAERIARAARLGPDRIAQAVLDRERIRTTAFPNGSALPHCRLAEVAGFFTALAILRRPLRWDAHGHAVDRVLMIVGPASAISDHLRILANGTQILDSPAVRAKLQTAPDVHSAYELVAAAEEAIEKRRAQVGVLGEVQRPPEQTDHLGPVADRFAW